MTGRLRIFADKYSQIIKEKQQQQQGQQTAAAICVLNATQRQHTLANKSYELAPLINRLGRAALFLNLSLKQRRKSAI